MCAKGDLTSFWGDDWVDRAPFSATAGRAPSSTLKLQVTGLSSAASSLTISPIVTAFLSAACKQISF